jgi:hypothetical protein
VALRNSSSAEMDGLKALVEKKKRILKESVGDKKWVKRTEREQRERELLYGVCSRAIMAHGIRHVAPA